MSAVSLPQPASDRTAVVTGASSGIGREFALGLASRGHQVVLVARRVEKLEKLASEVTAFGVRAHVRGADLSNRTARAQLLDRIADLGLTVDILINNAGLSTLGPVAKSDPDAEMNMIEVDVVAVADLCSRFLPGMVQRSRGAVLMWRRRPPFSRYQARRPTEREKPSCCPTRGVSPASCGETGVNVSALCPGPVDTGFGEAAGFAKEDAEAALPSFMWESAEAVAETGLDALDKNPHGGNPGRDEPGCVGLRASDAEESARADSRAPSPRATRLTSAKVY